MYISDHELSSFSHFLLTKQKIDSHSAKKIGDRKKIGEQKRFTNFWQDLMGISNEWQIFAKCLQRPWFEFLKAEEKE